MGSFEAEGNEGFGVSVSVPLPCPDSQPDYPLRHAQDGHIYRVCVRLPTNCGTFLSRAVDDVLPVGAIRFCASKSSRFNKRGCTPAQFRIPRCYLTIFVSLFTNIRNLDLVKLCWPKFVKAKRKDQPSSPTIYPYIHPQFYTL